MAIKRVRLISWDADLAKRRSEELAAGGVKVDASPFQHAGLVSQFKDVTVVVIDLDRLPSHGREIAVALRQTKATKFVPIVFAGGPKEKVLRIKKELPDAQYIEWGAAAHVLRKYVREKPLPAAASPEAVAEPVAEPVKPPSHMERYASAPLEKKLGFAAGMKVVLLGEPEGFQETLTALPEGVEFGRKMNAQTRMTLWFVRSKADVEREIAFVGDRLAPGASVWIVYPKKAGKRKSDLTQGDIRTIAGKAGMVDYKVVGIDEVWSGLKFARRK